MTAMSIMQSSFGILYQFECVAIPLRAIPECVKYISKPICIHQHFCTNVHPIKETDRRKWCSFMFLFRNTHTLNEVHASALKTNISLSVFVGIVSHCRHFYTRERMCAKWDEPKRKERKEKKMMKNNNTHKCKLSRDTVVFLPECKSVNKEKIRVNQKRECRKKKGITRNEREKRWSSKKSWRLQKSSRKTCIFIASLVRAWEVPLPLLNVCVYVYRRCGHCHP